MISKNIDYIFESIKEIDSFSEVIVYTQGVFDLLHHGHINFLIRAKALGTKLIIGLDSDLKVSKRKGITRPINLWQQRADQIYTLKLADYIFEKEINIDSSLYLAKIRPQIVVVSSDNHLTHSRKNFLKYNQIKLIVLERTPNISTSLLIASA